MVAQSCAVGMPTWNGKPEKQSDGVRVRIDTAVERDLSRPLSAYTLKQATVVSTLCCELVTSPFCWIRLLAFLGLLCEKPPEKTVES
jgi:hypothetical protein